MSILAANSVDIRHNQTAQVGGYTVKADGTATDLLAGVAPQDMVAETIDKSLVNQLRLAPDHSLSRTAPNGVTQAAMLNVATDGAGPHVEVSLITINPKLALEQVITSPLDMFGDPDMNSSREHYGILAAPASSAATATVSPDKNARASNGKVPDWIDAGTLHFSGESRSSGALADDHGNSVHLAGSAISLRVRYASADFSKIVDEHRVTGDEAEVLKGFKPNGGNSQFYKDALTAMAATSSPSTTGGTAKSAGGIPEGFDMSSLRFGQAVTGGMEPQMLLMNGDGEIVSLKGGPTGFRDDAPTPLMVQYRYGTASSTPPHEVTDKKEALALAQGFGTDGYAGGLMKQHLLRLGD